MPRIVFIETSGRDYEIEAQSGLSLMENAVRNGIDGIVAECGGACSCATCHVYIDEAWLNNVGLPSSIEKDMLDFAYDTQANSRLSCQIKVVDEFDGLIVRIPARQF